MLSFKEFIKESVDLKLPPEPGTAPVPEGHVRLYHQTGEHNLPSIEKEGIKLSSAKGIEGPKGIWASEPKDGKGFYGHPKDEPTVEFSVPEEEWKKSHPSLQRDIQPHEIIGIHYPWHDAVRYMHKNNMIDRVKKGEYDHLLQYPDWDDAKAIQHIKDKL